MVALDYYIMCVCMCLELLPESQFNVDMIVQTIRDSSSTPQIQQQALSLLSVSASLYPVSIVIVIINSCHSNIWQQVRLLHNIMPIFTFMGAYLSHHDDQYSFEIVLTALDSLLPMLMVSIILKGTIFTVTL